MHVFSTRTKLISPVDFVIQKSLVRSWKQFRRYFVIACTERRCWPHCQYFSLRVTRSNVRPRPVSAEVGRSIRIPRLARISLSPDGRRKGSEREGRGLAGRARTHRIASALDCCMPRSHYYWLRLDRWCELRLDLSQLHTERTPAHTNVLVHRAVPLHTPPGREENIITTSTQQPLLTTRRTCRVSLDTFLSTHQPPLSQLLSLPLDFLFSTFALLNNRWIMTQDNKKTT